MLLRTRITLFLSIAFLLVIAGLVAVGYARSQFEQERLARIAIEGQRSLWESLVAEEADDLRSVAMEIASALASSDDLTRDEIATAVAGVEIPPAKADDVQVVTLSGQLLYSNAPTIDERSLLDATAIRTILANRAHLGGLRQADPDRYVVASAAPVFHEDRITAIVVVASDANRALGHFTGTIGEPSYLVSLRGRLVEGTAPLLWREVDPRIPPRTADAQVVRSGDRLLLATGVPVPDMAGGTIGTLVTLRDSTEILETGQKLERAGLIGVASFTVLVIIALYFYMRHAFKPLEHAISVLDGLSKGNVNEMLDDTGSGEIRKISEAVSVFRRNTIALQEQQQQVERQRRRQERVIRRQLERLAETLEADGRAEIIDDLQAAVRRKQEPTLPGKQPTDDQLNVLSTVLQRMSARISDQHTRLTGLVKELQEAIITRARLAGLEQELEIARELQQSFLPHPLPPHSSFAIDGIMETAKEVGGDFFDYFMIDDRRLGIAVADVSGKGVPAALFMAITRTLVKATALFTNSPAASVTQVNQFMAADNDQMMFVTLFYGVLDLQTGVFTYANCGHNPPYLIHRDSKGLTPLKSTGDPALAVVEDHVYQEASITLAAGDTVFMFTDGVTEAFDIDGEAYGEGRLEPLLDQKASTTDVDGLGPVVLAALRDFERGADQADDITCLTLRYFGASTEGTMPGLVQTPSQSSGGGQSA